MKWNMKRNYKITLITINILLLVTLSFFVYKAIKYPGFNEEKISLYNYDNKTNIDYEVSLKPNILYDDESIGEGNIYITEFVDNIKANFNYAFSGEENSEINGNYEIVALVEGFRRDGDVYKTIWQKGFTLLPKTSFNTTDKSFSINENIPIKIDQYNSFAQKVIETSKISSQVQLTVLMNVDLQAKTDNGVVKEKMSPTMVIPLNVGYFEIMGNLSEDRPGGIEETKKTPLPVNRANVIIYSCGILVLLISLGLLLLKTNGVIITDPLEKELTMIFKKHGDRLVALNDEIAATCEGHSAVKTIDDLVRIADEIGKPIIYRHSPDFKEISKFYVNDENRMYLLDLTDVMIESGVGEIKKEKKKSADDVKKLRNIIAALKTSKKDEDESETTNS